MIEHLNKTHELVHFRNNTHILIRNNILSEAYPPHWHNEVEIVLVRSGKLQIRCGGIDYSMQAGDILIINPASIHEIHRENQGIPHLFAGRSIRFSAASGAAYGFFRIGPCCFDYPTDISGQLPYVSGLLPPHS